MKNPFKILLIIFPMVMIMHVSYATDVGKHSATKSEYTMPAMHVNYVVVVNDVAEFNFVAPAELKSFVVKPTNLVAMLAYDVGKEPDTATFLPVLTSNYRSPFVDKDYKWKYSAWYNC